MNNNESYVANKRPSIAVRCLIAGLFLALSFTVITGTSARAAAITSTATGGFWSANTTWVGGVVPGSADTVTIASGANVTVDTAASAASLTFTLAAASNSVIISGTNSLSVSGLISMPRPAVGFNTTLAVGAGTLTAGSLTMSATTTPRNDILSISTGTATITGAITTGTTGCQFTFTGAGIMNAGGNFTSTPALTTFTGSAVNYNATGPQTALVGTYYNLTLSGSGVKTFSTTPTVNGKLSLRGTATVVVTGGGVVTYGPAATLEYNTTTARTSTTEEWITPFAATGGIIIAGTGTITPDAAKVFSASVLLTINSGATLNSGNLSLTFGGNFTNNGTFTAGSSPVVIANTMVSQSIAGFTTTGTISMTKASGTATFTGNVSGAGLTINGAAGTLNLGANLTHTFSGNWTRTAGTLNGGSSTLNFSGAGVVFSGVGGTFTAGTGTVGYTNAAVQTFPALTFNNLTLSGGGIKTAATTPTVNGVLSLEGTATVVVTTGVVTYGPAAALQYNTATGRTSSAEEWITPFAGTGGVIIAGTGTITPDAAKVLNASVPLTINSGATLSTANVSLTFGGDFNNDGTLNAGSSSIVIASNVTQSIDGFTTTGLVSMTKTAGVATFTGNVSGAGMTINGAGGTLNLGAGLTHTFTGDVTLTTGTLNGGSSTLNENSTSVTAWSGTGTNFNAGTGTVTFGGVAQTLATASTFNSLNLSGSGTKTLSAATVVSGNLTVNSGVTLAMSTFLLTLNGNFTNNGNTTSGSGGVTINGTATQSIGGFTNTGTVSMTKTAGTATFTGNVSGGAFTLNGSGGTLDLGAGLTNNFTGDWTRTNGSLLGNSSTLTIGGNTTNTAGTFTAGSSTVNYNAEGAQTIATVTYNNLTLSGGGIKTAATTPTVNGILSLQGTATVVVTTGVITYGPAAALQYNTATGRTSTAEEWITPFAGTGGVIIAGTGPITPDAAKVFNASVPLTINSGATLLTNNLALNFGGSFTDSGGTFTAGSSNITIENSMAIQSIAGFTTTGTVSMTKTAGVATFTGNVSGAGLTVNGAGGTLNLGTGLTHTFSGTWTRTAGTLDGGSSTLNFSGAGVVFSGVGGTFTAGTGTVNYNGASQTIPPVNYNNLTINQSSGNATLNANAAVNGILTLTAGNLNVTDPNVLLMGSAATTSGATDVTGIVKRVTLVAATTYSFGNPYTTVTFQNTGTLPTDLSVKISIGSAPAWKTDAVKRYYELVRTGGSASVATLALHYLDAELNGNNETSMVKWASESPATPGSGAELGRSAQDATNNWVETSNFDVSIWHTSFGGRQLSLAASVSVGSTWHGQLSTDWTNLGNWTPGHVPAPTENVTIPDAATTNHAPTLPAGTTVINTLTLQSGAILTSGPTSNLTISGGNDAWFNAGGTFVPSTGMVSFNGSAATISGTTNFTNVAINSGADVTNETDSVMRIGGTITNSGTWHAAMLRSSVEYYGTNQAVLNPNGLTPGYHILILSGSGVKAMPGTTLSITDNFTMSGTASATAGAAINNSGSFTTGTGTTFNTGAFIHTIGGDFSNSGTFTATGSTIILNGSSAQTMIGSTTFNNVTLNNAGGLTLNNDETIGGTLTLTSGNFSVAANTLTLNGPTIAGTPGNLSTSSSSSLVYGGTSTGVTIPGSVAALNNLTVNNVNGIMTNSSPIVSGTLTLTNGKIATGSNTLNVAVSGSISGGGLAAYVNGNLGKAFDTGAGQSFTFPVGDASNYTPVNIASMTVGTSGTLVASTASGDHPNISTSNIDAAKSANRYWTLTAGGGLVVSTCNATFNFVNTDVDGGANTSNFVVMKYASGAWSAPAGGITTGSNYATGGGFTSFGDFAVGELKTPPTVTVVGLYQNDRTAAVTAMTPQVEYAVKVSATGAYSLSELTSVVVTIYYDPGGTYNPLNIPESGNTQTAAIMTLTVGGSPSWSTDPGTGTTWSIVPADSTQPSLAGTSGDFWFHFKPGKVATAGNDKWYIYARAISPYGSGENHQDSRTMNWYGEISVNTASIDFGSAELDSDFSANPQSGISVTYISNGAYGMQVKLSSPWTGSGKTITLNASGSPGTGEFSIKANGTSSLGSAIVATTNYVTIGTGTQTGESGVTNDTHTLWLKLGALGIPAVQYSGTIYYGITP